MDRRTTAGLVLAGMVWCVFDAPVLAVCRVIEPSGDPAAEGVVFDPRTRVFYAVRDEGETRKVVMALQPLLTAGEGHAALIMPVPPGASVERGARDLFEQLVLTTRGMVVETVVYQEDPSLGWQCEDPHYSTRSIGGARAMLVGDGGAMDGAVDASLPDGGATSDGGAWDAASAVDAAVVSDAGAAAADAGSLSTNLPLTDSYESERVVEPGDLSGLVGWLEARGLALSAEDRAALEPYVEEGYEWVVVHVTPDDHAPGTLVGLHPLLVRWETTGAVSLPERLQHDPRGGVLLTELFVAAATRVDLGDGSAETVFAEPMDLPSPLRDLGVENGWLTRMSLTRLQNVWKEDPPLVEGPPETVSNVVERTLNVRIAAACCPGQVIPAHGGTRTFTETREYPVGEEPSDDTLFFTAPPPSAEECGVPEAGPDRPDDDWGGGGCGPSDDSGGCASSGSSPGCRCGGACTVSPGPLGGGEPVALALGWLLWRARRRRSR